MWELSRARRCHWRALQLWRAGRFTAAQQQASRAVELFEQRRGRLPAFNPSELVAALLTLAGFHADLTAHPAAEGLHRRAVELLTTEPEGPARDALLLDALVRLGNGQRLQGHYADAETSLRKAITLAEGGGLEPQLRGTAFNALGIVCKDTGRYAEAAQYYSTARALFETAPGAVTFALASVYHNLAGLAYAQGCFAAAEGPARRAVALREQAGHPDSTEVAADAAVLGTVLTGLQRYAEAEVLLRRALNVWEWRFGPEHYEVAVSLHGLAVVHQQRGEPVAALRDFQEALRIKQSVLGGEHAEVAALFNNLAVLHAEQGRTEDTERYYHNALALFERTLGRQHPSTVRCRENRKRLSGLERRSSIRIG